MKIKTIYSILFVSLSIMLAGCSESDDIAGNDTPPAGATPSGEFNLNTLPDEPYAEDAIKIVAEDEDAPFYSLELMPDGHYMLVTRPYDAYASTVQVATETNGNISVFKAPKAKRVRTRAVTDEDGTVQLDRGVYYGSFERLGSKQYRLSNGATVDLSMTSSTKTLSYNYPGGPVIKFYVFVCKLDISYGTKSICHSWDYNSFECWAYLNGKYVAHGKQVINNGKVDSYFKSNWYDREDFLDDDDELCYKVVFTSAGTYICFYLDGTSEVSVWKWTDEKKGTLHYEDLLDDDYDEDYGGDVTVRFAGKQMRVYETVTDTTEGMEAKVVSVSTLTASNRK